MVVGFLDFWIFGLLLYEAAAVIIAGNRHCLVTRSSFIFFKKLFGWEKFKKQKKQKNKKKILNLIHVPIYQTKLIRHIHQTDLS